MARFIAFDLEISKLLPEKVDELLDHRPLGISCASTAEPGYTRGRTWYSERDAGGPRPEMTRADAIELVRYLQDRTEAGDTVVTWNGLHFDFVVLADLSRLDAECRELAFKHVDMMFHLFCLVGKRVSLARAAEGMNVTPKSKAVAGALVPQFWHDGKYDTVLEYAAQDAMTTFELAEACAAAERVDWTSKEGESVSVELPDGWLSVKDAMGLPNPWLGNPESRADFTDWLEGE